MRDEIKVYFQKSKFVKNVIREYENVDPCADGRLHFLFRELDDFLQMGPSALVDLYHSLNKAL